MKAKNVRSVCKSKVREWLATITDEGVRDLASKNTIITGGSIASMLLGEPVNDFDIYFRTRESCLSVAKYYVAKFMEAHKLKHASGATIDIKVDDWSRPDRIQIRVQSAGVASENSENNYQYFEQTDPNSGDAEEYASAALKKVEEINEEASKSPKFRPVYMTTNAITLSHDIQLVMRFYGEPDEIHQNYDFVHCTNYWCSWNNELVLRQPALESLLARELKYVGSKYPLCSMIRTRKFIQRNWKISAGAYLKIAMNLQQFDLTNVGVLEDQLTGVDTAFFLQIIEALKAKDDKVVDTAYLIELIDRMF